MNTLICVKIELFVCVVDRSHYATSDDSLLAEDQLKRLRFDVVSLANFFDPLFLQCANATTN